jgi:ribonuclease HI
MEALALQLNVTDFDLMIVGDGSGTTIAKSCGWFCSSWNRKENVFRKHYGGASHGTNQYAELAPYLHALYFYHASKQDAFLPHVLIVTDSEVTARCGSGQYERRALAPLWAQIEWFEKAGYKFTWKSVPRNSHPTLVLADSVAGRLRTLIGEIDAGSFLLS